MATKKLKKAKPPEPPKQWTLNGQCYDPTAIGNAREDVITLPVRGTCISNLPSSTGRPINASLAVHFIENFLNFFSIHRQEHDKCERFLDEGNVEEARKSQRAIRKIFDKVIEIKSGTTFDKDLILKILSQPKCEGIRCYLCARETNGDDPYAISLVVVGVDGEGYDLHYNLEDTVRRGATDGDDIVTQSLTGEYGSPPPPEGDGLRQEGIDERYVLLKLANRTGII